LTNASSRHEKEPASKQVRCALVTGAIGAGKSTVASRVVELARRQGLSVAGLWCPARVQAGAKAGIDAVALAGNERRPLALCNSPALEGVFFRRNPAARTGRYTFVPGAFAWANRVLAAAVACRPDLLVVDEIGPLELEQGEGLAPVIADLAAGRVPRALVIVRDRLVETLRTRLCLPGASTFPVDAHTRETAPEHILAWLLAGQEPC
jgi:nucleoside-triphosphatase THEP1